MDPAQLANEAVRRLVALRTSGSSEARELGGEAVSELFEQLAVLDGWAKIARDRLVADPKDGRAAADLRRSCEQTARLHPHFIRRLVDVVDGRPAVKTALTVPSQPIKGVPAPH